MVSHLGVLCWAWSSEKCFVCAFNWLGQHKEHGKNNQQHWPSSSCIFVQFNVSYTLILSYGIMLRKDLQCFLKKSIIYPIG